MPYASYEIQRLHAMLYGKVNRVHTQAYYKKWRAKNPNYNSKRTAADVSVYLNMILHCIHDRSKSRWAVANPKQLTLTTLMRLWEKQKGLCAVTGLPMTHTQGPKNGPYYNTNVSVDRINGTKNYSRKNIQLVCRRVNSMRSEMTQPDFIAWCRYVADANPNPLLQSF